MNKAEAAAILQEHIDGMEARGYAALALRIGEVEVFEQMGETGVTYQLELSVIWDQEPQGAIRILGSIDDGGIRAFVPLVDSRLVQPRTP